MIRKLIAPLLILALCGPSCAILYQPSMKRASWAPQARYWMKQRSDGYYVVNVSRGFAPTKVYVFECKPDSAQLSKL